jgi:hypothetical protein
MTIYDRMLAGVSAMALRAAAGEGNGGGDGGDDNGGGDPPSDDGQGDDGGDQGDEGKPKPAAAAGDPPADDGDDTPEEPAAHKPDWRDKQIAKQHRLLKERERELAALRTLREAGGGQADGGAADPPKPQRQQFATQQDFDAAVAAAAQAKLAEKEANDQATDTHTKGQANYGDKWAASIQTLQALGGLPVEDGSYQGVMATDEPHKVIHYLGQHPDEYHRIMDLPPHKRLTEFVKISMRDEPKPAPKKVVSDAPVPAAALNGRSNTMPGELKDELSDDEWYAKRRAQKEARRKAMARA